MGVYEKSKDEFRRLRENLPEDCDQWPVVLEFENEILSLVQKFGESGQSGGSAPYVSSIIAQTVKKLCMFEPLSPIYDIPEDWGMCDGSSMQNCRESALFKDKLTNKCHYIYAIVWQGEDSWDSFTGTVEGVSSSQFVKEFPFTPKTFRIDVVRELNDTSPDRVSCGDGDYLYKIKDKSQLEAVWEYYRKEE